MDGIPENRSSRPGTAAVFLKLHWIAGLLLLARAASSHEMGALKVDVEFGKDQVFRVDIQVETHHLPLAENPLLGLPALPTQEAVSSPGVQAHIEEFRKKFLDSVAIAFDGRACPWKEEKLPESLILPAPSNDNPRPQSPKLAFRLAGRIPSDAQAFTWKHGMQLGAYLISVRGEGDENPAYEWLVGGKTSHDFPLRQEAAPMTRFEVIELYLKLGFTHILPYGLDHILFVLGIFLLSLKVKPVLLQVTSFTIAHTITLGLTIYGVVSLSPRVVEPMIAISIVYVAVENIITTEIKPWRVAVVFGFGLLHGMGFAGVLSELGLPEGQFIPALLSFNAGVELGQLSVICLAYFLAGMWFGRKPWYRRAIVIPGSLLIAAIGAYWTVERVFFQY